MTNIVIGKGEHRAQKGPVHMNAHKFIAQSASHSVSAAAFIAAEREFLQTGDLGKMTEGILRRFDSDIVGAEPTLAELRRAVMSFMVHQSLSACPPKAVKKQIAKKSSNGGEYVIVIYNDNDAEVERRSQDDRIHAEAWADRKLDNGGPRWYAIVTRGGKFVDKINRDQSIARLYGRKEAQPVMKDVGKVSDAKWRMHAKQSHSYFSRG